MKPTHRNPLLRNLVLAATIYLTLGQAAHATALTCTGGAGVWQDDTQGGWSTVWSNSYPNTGTFINDPGGAVDVQSNITTGTTPALAFSAGNDALSAVSPFSSTLSNSSTLLATAAPRAHAESPSPVNGR